MHHRSSLAFIKSHIGDSNVWLCSYSCNAMLKTRKHLCRLHRTSIIYHHMAWVPVTCGHAKRNRAERWRTNATPAGLPALFHAGVHPSIPDIFSSRSLRNCLLTSGFMLYRFLAPYFIITIHLLLLPSPSLVFHRPELCNRWVHEQPIRWR